MEPESRESVGLCADCIHARTVKTRRSVFWRCARAATDPRFVKYPRLPVLECRGYEPRAERAPGALPGGPAGRSE